MTDKQENRQDAIKGCLLLLVLSIAGVYGVCSLCSTDSNQKTESTPSVPATPTNRTACPVVFPVNFIPAYRFAKIDLGDVRIGAAVVVPDGLDWQTLTLNLEHALCVLLLEWHPKGGPRGQGLAAIWVHGYRAQDVVGHGFTAGNATIAPYGNFAESIFNMDAPLSEWKITFTPGSADSYLEGPKQL